MDTFRDGPADRLSPSLEQAVFFGFETDPDAPNYQGLPLQLANLEDYDLEIDAGEGATGVAAVTRLLSRSETMAKLKAKEATRKEAASPVEKGTSDLSTVTE